ncbi:MAG TPA: hypothetical protein VL309_08575 [Vicinamibacterales bacterium]|nr:hypothetical protein [Vicinamibacterales bacterium]
MDQPNSPNQGPGRWWRVRVDLATVTALSALTLSGLSFYRSYIYTKQQLEVTVTEVSYVTNQGELYMTVAFSNGGNRDAALLRVEPALWGRRNKPEAEWIPLATRVRADIAVTTPKMPTVVKAGGVEMVALAARLEPEDAERAAVAAQGGAFIGIRVATMNSDGNLYLLQHPVARLTVDKRGHIQDAEPTIHQSLSGFSDLLGAPPGDHLQSNKKTPFVWADEHF